MSMSESGPQYSEDVYYYYIKSGKKVRVRIAKISEDKEYKYSFMQVRDGRTYLARSIDHLIKE